MPPRARRAVAGLLILLFLAAYVWAVIALSGLLPNHWLIDLIFFAAAGIAWGVPIIPILRWAERA